VFGGGGGGEVPFYVAGTTGEGDVVEVDYLPILVSAYTLGAFETHPKYEFEFWLYHVLVMVLYCLCA
jgi:hypothetical protein